MSYPRPEFWAVIEDICQQAEREWMSYPDEKSAKVQVIKPEIAELRAALGSPR